MYIWILLATIMIALSFFNLSPRADKEGVFAEVKAESLVSRFRTEHSAFSRVAECKLVHDIKIPGMGVSKVSKFDPSDGVDKYIWENRSLPIGYDYEHSDLNVYHYTFCLERDLFKGGSPVLDECTDERANPNNRAYRYSVSFAPLPARWRSKIAGEVETVPILNSALSKQHVKGSVLGLLNCSMDETSGEASDCLFSGSRAYIQKKEEGAVYLSFTPDSGTGNDFYEVLFSNGDFKENCAGNICFFAVHRLSNIDVDGHCEALYAEYSAAMSQE